MKLILPFPPSVNTYWRHPNKGAFAGKSLISSAGRKFQSAACAAIVEQLRRLPKPTSAPASVEIVLFPPDNHAVTMPELCWWLIRNDLADALPESAARKALRLPKPVVPSVTRESDLVPSVPATSIIQDKAKKVLALKVDPESPESFMLRPKRRRWVNEKYTRWVKTQPCACCGKPADDPHHLIGHGQGGMGTKAHDLFVLPLCRKHHDELHADTVAFEEKYGSQLELIFRFIDRALAIGVLA